MTEQHDHDLELVLVCRKCGEAMRDPTDDDAVTVRLRRYVSPHITASDNLTSVETTSFVFDVQEERHA